MMDFTASLDAEIARLEAAIANIPEVKQLRELKRVRALYDTLGAINNNLSEMVAQSSGRTPIADYLIKTGGRKPSPERVRAMEFVRKLVTRSNVPIRTADILTELQKEGIEIGGADEISNLSAMISASGQFKAHGRSGWTLKTAEDRVLDEPG